ncbi:MAG: hypothetical protein JWN63_2574 [Candidatus Acidoferrum typicum]|nr:hypothetical protein [Candidatus Acidoferrum typicum]
MEILCCGKPMREVGGGLRCHDCGRQSNGAVTAIQPTHGRPYIQPGTDNPPPLSHLTGAMGRSKNGPFTEE